MDKQLKQIEVITSTNIEGKMRPHKFRLQAEDESLVVVPIMGIIYMEEDKKEKRIKYRVKCVIQNKERICDLFFYKSEMKWYVFM